MAELTVYTPEMPWEVLSFIPGDAEVKILRAEPEGGARTMLVRLSPGGEISPHDHLGVVQHYVLEGEYETEGEMFGAGTYRLLPKHARVGTMSAGKGAVIRDEDGAVRRSNSLDHGADLLQSLALADKLAVESACLGFDLIGGDRSGEKS